MGVDTKVKFKGFVTPLEVIKVLEKNLGLSVVDDTRVEKRVFHGDNIVYLGKHGIIKTTLGFINFEYKGEYRSLWYYYSDAVFVQENDTMYWIKEGLPELIGETTNLSLAYNDNAVEILTEVARELGGYIDENDCDDEDFHKVVKD